VDLAWDTADAAGAADALIAVPDIRANPAAVARTILLILQRRSAAAAPESPSRSVLATMCACTRPTVNNPFTFSIGVWLRPGSISASEPHLRIHPAGTSSALCYPRLKRA